MLYIIKLKHSKPR